MKISNEHFNELSNLIKPLITEEVIVNYKARNIYNGDKVKDINMRLRWDLLNATGFDIRKLYDSGMNDSHIVTALKRIVANIE